RQVGKTTLIKDLIKKLSYKTLSINADEQKYNEVLSSKDFQKIRSLVSGYELLFIDEAQKIPEIGINLKILIDQMPQLKIIATGSSSFDLANKVNEPLTGRAWNYTLYPIAFVELKEIYNDFELKSQLEERLVYGSYPEIFSLENNQLKLEYLQNLSTSYLYKDILELATIKHSNKLKDLLKLLAFQIGNQVSISELANSLDISKSAVANYIDLLEKTFVIFRMSGLSRNLRKEVSKMDKIYFYDLGIRNIVIDNLKNLNDRNDVGQLWENFLIIERLKLLNYKLIPASGYFWRLHTGVELDYVEEREGSLYGYEFKYGKKNPKAPKIWKETYENSEFELINRENFLDFLLKK
ncbi:ATP-binding protein, partial [Candidatus Peregrinibacteria bacterium]|nr:ATP-binding protein [Candidatus Peregrinibacteria bacterium]